jgi:hypothetical protein
MTERFLKVRVIWDHQVISLPGLGFRDLHVLPGERSPFGSKGNALATMWETLGKSRGMDGMMILDGDTVIDPLDLDAMQAAITSEPKAVHVAPVRLWPAGTGLTGWVWGHGKDLFSQQDPRDPDRFGFSFTWLPAQLLDHCIQAGMRTWSYPHVDDRVSQEARRMVVPVRVVRGASPKHTHF